MISTHTYTYCYFLFHQHHSLQLLQAGDYGFTKKALYMHFLLITNQQCLKAMTADTNHEKLSTGQFLDLLI